MIFFINKQTPVRFIWKPTYSTKDKQPYGAYAFDKILETSWEKDYIHTHQRIIDLEENNELEGKNLLIVTESFYLSNDEIGALLEFVKRGGNALIVAKYYIPDFCEKLGFRVSYETKFDISLDKKHEESFDTLRFNSPFFQQKSYQFPSAITPAYFYLQKEQRRDSVFVIAKNQEKHPVMIGFPMKKGNLILFCNPLVFTNYGILNGGNNGFIGSALAFVKDKPLIRSEYYHSGYYSDSKKSSSPLSHVMSQRSLKWALYVTFFTIALFMIFTAKRKQKPIPVVKPPPNKILDFVRSIASLYLHKNNNSDIIHKKYIYWADSLKHKYGLDIINEKHNADFFERFASKTGQSTSSIQELFRYLDEIYEDTRVSDDRMMKLITQMKKIK